MSAGRARCLLFAAVVAAATGLAGPAPAADGADLAVDLELVLAVDISMSMTASEASLQRHGYVEALRDPEVVAALVGGPLGRVAVTYLEWAGLAPNRFVVPWTLIDSPQAAAGFADRLAASRLSRVDRTSISRALLDAGQSFDGNGFDGARRVIDISGDGPNNEGEPLPAARDRLVAAGVTINGLALTMGADVSGFDTARLDSYYRNCVVGGDGAFVLAVSDWREFGRALRLKLLTEVSGAAPQAVAQPVALDMSDCTVGEQLWDRFMRRFGPVR